MGARDAGWVVMGSRGADITAMRPLTRWWEALDMRLRSSLHKDISLLHGKAWQLEWCLNWRHRRKGRVAERKRLAISVVLNTAPEMDMKANTPPKKSRQI